MKYKPPVKDGQPYWVPVVVKNKEYLTGFKSPWRFLKVRQNERILSKAGFQDIKVDPYYYTMKFENEDDLVNYFKAAGLVLFLSIIPEDKHDAFIEKFKEVHYEVNKEQPLEISMNRAFISAMK